MTATSPFALPERLAAKADTGHIGADKAHFASIAAALESAVADVSTQLDEVRAAPARLGQELLERDLDITRLTSRLRLLRRYALDLCLGRMVPAGGGEPVYVGRIGLKDRGGRTLLVDWRTPAAEPFFAATTAEPMGLASRRRYRWSLGRVVDYWDEVLAAGSGGSAAAGRRARAGLALDAESSFLASLGQSRTRRMRDVLGTLAADQDAIIRADSHGPLLVDGGPGTGKTVVALHRAAYLLYADPLLTRGGGSVLFIGPHEGYLAYVADVLPSLGDDGVQTATLADLVPEAAGAGVERDSRAAELKSSSVLVEAIEPAVAFYETPPTEVLEVETPWGGVRFGRRDWADAFAAVAPGTPHNEARAQIWDELAEIATAKLVAAGADEDVVSVEAVGTQLRRDDELTDALSRSWPLLDPTDVVADLWEVPAYLRHCAPSLTPEERIALRRNMPRAWTAADLPLLDAARHRLGDVDAERRERRRLAREAAARAEMDSVIEHLIASDDSEMHVMSMLKVDDLRGALLRDAGGAGPDADVLAGPFTHVVVDEAQELTDAQWAMILRRCPSRSLTIVGDRAQARHGFTQSWLERLGRVGLERVRMSSLTINYRTPAEVMEYAAPVILEVLPDANVPTSIRRSGMPVRHGAVADLVGVVRDWLARHDEGIAAVIVGEAAAPSAVPAELHALEGVERVQVLTPVSAKGLEFDLVVLIHPVAFGEGLTGAVDRYVAMTRATGELVVLD